MQPTLSLYYLFHNSTTASTLTNATNRLPPPFRCIAASALCTRWSTSKCRNPRRDKNYRRNCSHITWRFLQIHIFNSELFLILNIHFGLKVRDEDVERLRTSMSDTERPAGMPSPAEFMSFAYNPRGCDRIHTARLSMQMFFDLQFVELFKIRDEKLARFVLTVQKGYRDTVPYHNWTHAFSVAHFGFTLIHNLQLVERGILR